MRLCLPFALLLHLIFAGIGGLEDTDFSNSDDSSSSNLPTSETFLPASASTLEDKDNPKAAEVEVGDGVSESGGTDVDVTLLGSVEESEDINTCGKPPVIERTRILGKNSPPYTIGTSLSYSCEFGYSADRATHFSRCTKSVTDNKPVWSDPQIVCNPRACGDPGFVANAERIGSQFTFPNSVSFECDEGYQLQGPNIRYCQVNGMWSSTLPSCEKVTCETPKKPENGEVIFSSLDYGSSLRYTCNQGFILKNYNSRICSENGTWSGTEPVCAEAKCAVPVAPDHGSVEMGGGIPRIDSIAVFSCEEGRELIGSPVSKCLDIGEWTFPTPKCSEPCSVPSPQFGIIGKYEKSVYSNRKQFVRLNPGARIKDGEELILRCEQNYEPLGKNKDEVKVFCEKGEWKEIPLCVPAKCKNNPPATENAGVARIDKEHGGIVVYHCYKDFVKAKSGNVTCHFGVWTGFTPICADKRCYVNKIRFPGVKQDVKNVYFDREVFKPSCEDGYEDARPENTFTCEKGSWKGHFPPCKPASCSTDPPSIENGRIKSYTGLHSTYVQYECGDSYLMTSSKVQCIFGTWRGNAPSCKDTRCYFQDLLQKEGMILPSKDPTESGMILDVQCAAGYHMHHPKPFCSRGKWTEARASMCKENSCSVHMIQNGAITELSYHKRYRLGRKEPRYDAVRIGTQIDAGKFLHITCTGGFTFHGKNLNNVKITCTRGNWLPAPVCSTPGNIYKEEPEEVPVAAHRKVNAEDSINPVTSSSTTTGSDMLNVSAPVLESPESTEDCFCEYTGSESLVAYIGYQLLRAGDKVGKNSIVKFHCRDFGYARMTGDAELMCEQCRSWDVTEYPRCEPPSLGDAIIMLNKNVRILPGGVLMANQGVDLVILCNGYGIGRYPIWTFPPPYEGVQALHHYDNQFKNPYLGVLQIRNTSPLNNGEYHCALDGYRETAIQLQVNVRCKQIEEGDDLIAHYDNAGFVNSSVLFTCRDKKKKIEGSSVLTCLSNGQWSEEAPRCVFKGCQELKSKENLEIIYSNRLQPGSRATFHCHVPYGRNGVSFLNCLPNGDWSGDVPTCDPPTCSLEELYGQLPEVVTPDLKEETDNILPYKFKVNLTCDVNMRLSAPAYAECGADGKWTVPETKCVSGCAPVQILPGSQMIIEPQKEFYKFGEYVELSCVPGQILSNEVEVLMCLRTGWSETEIPSCKDSDTENT